MLIKNARKNDTNWEFDLDLTETEVDFMVNFAMLNLLEAGVVSVKEQEEAQEVVLPQQNAPAPDTLN